MKIQMLNGASQYFDTGFKPGKPGVTDLYMQPDGVYGMGCPDCGGSCLGLGDTSTTFSVDQIVGKTLIAKVDVTARTLPNDNAAASHTIKAGQAIGVVDTYFSPAAGRSAVYWGFRFTDGKPFYVKHVTGLFDVSNLKAEGAKDLATLQQEKEDAELKENDPVLYYIKKIALPAALIIGGVILAATIGKETVRGAFNRKSAPQPAPAPALSGPRRKRSPKRKPKQLKS